MANPIDLIITKQALEVVDSAIAKVNLLDKTMQEATQHFIDNSKKMASATPSGVNGSAENNAAVTAQLKEQSETIAKLSNELVVLNDKLVKLNETKARGKKLTADEIVQNQQERKQAIELAKANSELIGSYDKLNIKHQQAVRNAQNLGATYGSTSKQFKQASAAANVLDKELKDIDKTLGKSQRNVGNYTQGFNQLGGVLGALGITTGIAGVVALGTNIFNTTKELISLNNALMLVTETQENFKSQQIFLTRISEAYGIELNGLTKQFTQFYVSAKDKLSGREVQGIFESITKAGSAMGLSTQSQERAFMALNQMMSKGTIQAEELRGQLGEALPGSLGIMAKALGVTEKKLGEMMKAGELLASDVLPKFAKQLEITYGIENINRIDNLASAQNRLTNAWTRFVAGLDEDGNKLSTFFSKTIGVLTKIVEGTTLLFESSETTRQKALGKFREDGYNQTLKYYKSLDELKREDLMNDKLYTQDKINQELAEFNRLKGRNLILKALRRDTPLGTIETTENKNERIENEAKMKALNNLIASRVGNVKAVNELLASEKKATAVTKELTKEELKAIEDRLKALYDANKKELELQLAKIDIVLDNEDNYYTDRLTALDKDNVIRLKIAQLDYEEHFRLAKDDKNKQRSAEIDHQIAILGIAEKYGKERIALEKLQLKSIEVIKSKSDDSLKKNAENAIKVLQKQQESVKKLSEFYKELQQNTDDWLGSFSSEFLQNSGFGSLETFMDGTFNKLLAGADTTREKFAVTFNAIAESAQEAFNFISNASQQNFDDEKNRLQSQYDIALTYAGDNKAAQEKLAEDLEKNKKDIDYREAKAKQKQAVFNIAIDTAQAVMSAIAESPLTFGLPWSAIIAGMGLAQASMVASQEIPRYFMGGTHDGGLMMVNDGAGSNYKETIVTPDGKIMKPQGRNVVMNAPIGTEIFTASQWDAQLNDMLKGNGINWNMPTQQQNGISKNDMKEAMLESIAEQPQYHTNFDGNGVVSYIAKRGNITRTNTNRSNGKGICFK